MNYWLSFLFKEIHIQDVLLRNWQKWEICQINIKANIFHVFKCEDLRHDDNTFTLLPIIVKIRKKIEWPNEFFMGILSNDQSKRALSIIHDNSWVMSSNVFHHISQTNCKIHLRLFIFTYKILYHSLYTLYTHIMWMRLPNFNALKNSEHSVENIKRKWRVKCMLNQIFFDIKWS